MEGVWKIEDTHECASNSNSARFRNWRKNAALAAETDVVLNLVESVM